MPVAVRKAEHAGWETVELQHRDGSTATVQGLGAQVTSWCDASNGEQLFVSRASLFAVGEPIAGGVGVCFPMFTYEEEVRHQRAAREAGTLRKKDAVALEPSMGFARTMVWEVMAKEADDRKDPWVTLQLRDNSMTSVLFPHQFQLELRVTLACAALDTELTVRNTALSPLYAAPTASPIYGTRAFSFQAALKNWLVAAPTWDTAPGEGGEADGGAHGKHAPPGTPFSLPGSQRPRSVDQRAGFMSAALDATGSESLYDKSFADHAATGEKLLPAEEAAAAAAEDDIDPVRLAEIRKKKTSEMTKEEMEMDARARIRRRHQSLAANQKARQRSTAHGLKQAKEALRETVLGAVVTGLHGCNFSDLDNGLVEDARARREEQRRVRRESGMSEANADAAEQQEDWQRDQEQQHGEVSPDSHGVARVYLGVPERRGVLVRCGERRCLVARNGFPDLGVSNCGRDREVDLPAMHTGGWAQHICVEPMARVSVELLPGASWSARQRLSIPPPTLASSHLHPMLHAPLPTPASLLAEVQGVVLDTMSVAVDWRSYIAAELERVLGPCLDPSHQALHLPSIYGPGNPPSPPPSDRKKLGMSGVLAEETDWEALATQWRADNLADSTVFADGEGLASGIVARRRGLDRIVEYLKPAMLVGEALAEEDLERLARAWLRAPAWEDVSG